MTDTISTPPLRDLPTGHLDVRKEHLLAEIAREPTGRRPTAHVRLPLPMHSRRWRIAAVAVAAAAAAAIAVPLLVLTGNGGLGSAKPYIHPLPRISTNQGGGRELASLVLLRAARTAAKQPWRPLRPGQFFYTKTEGFEAGIAFSGRYPHPRANYYFRPVTRETWVAPDGSGRHREIDGHLQFATAADAAYFYHALRNQPDILNGHSADSTVEPGGSPYQDLSNYPTDPAKLKQRLERRKPGTLESAPRGDADTFVIIGNLLRYTYAPPAVRSALYKVASQLPGVQLIGPTHDQLGRPGIGVAYGLPQPQGRASKNLSNELIFDPKTSTLLATQWVVVHRFNGAPFPPGTVINSTAYVAFGVVNSTSATIPATP
ncbi:MAG TPA: CU044_5270 family protein [Gaiellaceae bacterium]|nr:CU044_5270 family protein [Gaiellaceae bacterium]